MSGIMQYLSFRDWPVSHSKISSSSSTLSHLSALHVSSTHLSTDVGIVSTFYLLGTVSNAAMNVRGRIPLRASAFDSFCVCVLVTFIFLVFTFQFELTFVALVSGVQHGSWTCA